MVPTTTEQSAGCNDNFNDAEDSVLLRPLAVLRRR
jgi:hypothetical protein